MSRGTEPTPRRRALIAGLLAGTLLGPPASVQDVAIAGAGSDQDEAGRLTGDRCRPRSA